MKSILLVISSLMIVSLSFGQEVAEDKFKQTEAELNSIYDKILNEYKADTVFIKHLRQSQFFWKKFRDAEMEMKFPDTINGRSSTSYWNCVYLYKDKITRVRINALRIWLEGVKDWKECDGSLEKRH